MSVFNGTSYEKHLWMNFNRQKKMIIYLILSLLALQVTAQSKSLNSTSQNNTKIIETTSYLPDVIKDDLIKIIHLHNIAIIYNEIPQDEDFMGTCIDALEQMKLVGENLTSDSAFLRPENDSIVNQILNITHEVNVIQQEVIHAKDKRIRYGELLNGTELREMLKNVMTLCHAFADNVTFENVSEIIFFLSKIHKIY